MTITSKDHSFLVYTNENAFIRFHFHSIPDKTVRWQWIQVSKNFSFFIDGYYMKNIIEIFTKLEKRPLKIKLVPIPLKVHENLSYRRVGKTRLQFLKRLTAILLGCWVYWRTRWRVTVTTCYFDFLRHC